MIPNHTEERRCVLFDQQNAVSIVQSAKRYGLEATTYQSMERIVNFSLTALAYDVNPEDNSLLHQGRKFIGRWEKTGTPMSADEIQMKLEAIPQDVVHWLMGNGNNLLPAGYGWDGKHTNIELARAGKIKQLIIGEKNFINITNEVIDEITADILVTPNSNLMQDWNEAIPFTDVIYPTARNEDSKIFVFAQNDEVSVYIPVDSGIYNFTLDEQYDRCVIVVTKFFHSENYPNYGASLNLYKRKIDNDS